MKSKTAKEVLKRPYSRVLVADEATGQFSARIVEFSGCFAEGKTAAEAARRLESAAEAWLEAVIARGQSVPEPARESEYSGRFNLRLPRSLHEQCALSAQKEGVSLNQFVMYALGQYFREPRAADASAQRVAVTVNTFNVYSNAGLYAGTVPNDQLWRESTAGSRQTLH